MNDSDDLQEGQHRSKDQTDGSRMSLGNKKGVWVTGKYGSLVDMRSRGPGPSVIHPQETPSLVSMGSPRPPESTSDYRLDEQAGEEDCSREASSQVGVYRQTIEELKTMLRDSPLPKPQTRDRGKPARPYTCLHRTSSRGGGEPNGQEGSGSPQRTFSTFKPPTDGSRGGAGSRDSTTIQTPFSMDASSSFGQPSRTNRLPGVGTRPHSDSSSWGETRDSHSDNGNRATDLSGSLKFVASMERIKQQIAHENITFVRFEATDLHGVSRSKTVPVRFFHEKAIYGVPMPRSYLELTLSPKSNEVDHANTANFSSDVLLIPDLSTFRVLPWAEQTARVICDPCTVTGSPLRTSPRLIAKQLLGQLQSLGFSLHSSFTYECCVLGAPDRIGPKTLLFPATTLLSSHDLPFFQQLVDNMYCVGADIDSIASASGPGQMEINLRPDFGIGAADSAFTFRTGIKEMARKHSYIASFFTDDGLYNAGVLSHSLWDANGRRSLFHSGEKAEELSEIGRRWLAGLLTHSAALSCLMSPGLGCRSHIAKMLKDPKRTLYATFGSNDNSSSFNIKCHGGRETHIDNKLGSAMANPYIVLAATVAAGLDGIRRNLNMESVVNKAPSQQREFTIPVKLDEALEALGEDHVMRCALGEPFVQYFIAMKMFEIETQELDDERNKCLEYFI